MIRRAMEYIAELRAANVTEIDGKAYTDKKLEMVNTESYAGVFSLTTLSGLVEYIKSGVDEMKGKMIVHIESPTQINVFSELDKYRRRERVVAVEAMLPQITVDAFVDREKFNIALQSKFVGNEDRDLLLKFVGTVEDGTVQEYGDDGVTQKATIKTGIASKGDAIVPNPVVLRPFRTFTEVEQPASAFVFRMKSDRGVMCALYEADGGAWKREAMENVKAYLKEALADVEGYTIIS